MKLLPMLLLLLPTIASAAEFCPSSAPSNTWGIQYQLSGEKQGTLLLLRQQAQTVFYNPQNQVAEWWNFDNPQHPQFSRVFGEAKRRIDYYMGDLRTLGVQVSQTEIESFAAAHLRQVLTKEPQSACAEAEAYEGDYHQVHYRMLWSTALQLPLSLETTVQGKVSRWQAQQFVATDDVTQHFQQWQTYKSTDFADVGDNEQDPFLAKMINQGFVEHSEHAAYDSHGNPLGSHHH
ncbi:hypothetical protein [Shewanella dokdonensis]|uniref:hypothetical protein n=1 Tax=Shewanella dokdonensis TaxID=712036 RepID=UPI00200D73ED|nr:hypothetical protein [Shewanella dokdonensis]MCL1074763.1 hypothetical protein [Shewanella dokdonensis]